jgi:uncharacterized protein
MPVEPTMVALDAIIRRAEAPPRAREDLARWLRERGVPDDDVAALVEVGAERLLVYRDLVHNRMRNATRSFIRRAARRRGADFRRDFEAFLDERASHSPYLRDVPAEFVAWVEPRWRADPTVPAWLHELARHELLDTSLRDEPRGGEPATDLPLMLDRPVRLDGTTRLCRYGFAVHRIGIDGEDEPRLEDTELLAYRDRQSHRVRYLQLVPFATAAIAHLLRGEALAEALRGTAADLGEALDDDKLAAAAELLADLAERGVVLGAEG